MIIEFSYFLELYLRKSNLFFFSSAASLTSTCVELFGFGTVSSLSVRYTPSGISPVNSVNILNICEYDNLASRSETCT